MSANLQELIDSVEEGLLIVGPEGTVKIANRAASEALRATPGKPLAADEIRVQLAAVARGYARLPLHLDIQSLTDPEEILGVRIAPSPVGGGYLITLRKLGEIQRYRTVIANLATLLDTELGHAMQSFSEALRETLRKTLHDLPEARQAAEADARQLHATGEQLIGQVTQLATFAEAFANKPVVATDRIEVGGLIKGLLQRASPLLSGRNLKLHVSWPANLELPVIYGSRDWLVEALYGYVEYLVCHCQIESDLELQVRPYGNFVSLQFHNHGLVVSKDVAARSSLPFGRALTRPAEVQGLEPHTLGLGLALCKHVIELHRGGVRLEESDDIASSLCIELPAGAPPETVNPQLGAEQARRYAEDLTRLMQRQRQLAQP